MTATLERLLVGGGKMGGAMLRGWLNQGVPASTIGIVEPIDALRDTLLSECGVRAVANIGQLDPACRPGVVVLAVKPQVVDAVIPACARFVSRETIFLSVVAGRTLATLQGHLGGEAAVIRAMPNTPAAVGRGMTVCVANERTDTAHRELCQPLLEAVGDVIWVTDEDLMDAVTGVSGSGPAYAFLMTEALAVAGEKAGLPTQIARRLARATVAGAGELMYRSGEEPETLRENVTSPGGTTAAALTVLMDPETGWQPVIDRAVAAAAQRSRELARS